jgi:cytochrome c biogenesis protein CcmG/thiol:disulfide interchange protein DsbE
MAGITKNTWALLLFLTLVHAPAWSVEVGEPLPGFSFQTFDGKNLSRAALAGKPMLLVFWNSWCDDCMRELPLINRLAQRFGPRGVAVIAINTGLNDSESKARAYWKRSAYVFPTGYDHSFEIGKAFRVVGVPALFLVDARGVVRYKSPLLPGDIEARMEQLIRR